MGDPYDFSDNLVFQTGVTTHDGQKSIFLGHHVLQFYSNDKIETDTLFVLGIQAKDFYVLCKFWPKSKFIREADW